MKPLVSILIPAYNAEAWIADTIQSALAQTWSRKEIIVVDDGSSDRTAEVARRFASKQVAVVCTRDIWGFYDYMEWKREPGCCGGSQPCLAAQPGDYIQWLDADDLLAPDKIERQLAALREVDSRRVLLSSSWAYFNYRSHRARFVPTSLWQDLSPVEWLLRKMGEKCTCKTATWLTSRELAETAGWDTRLLSDDDVEYFCRALLASKGTCFVPEARVFYRITQSSRPSHIGGSDRKKDAMLISMKLQFSTSDRVKIVTASERLAWPT